MPIPAVETPSTSLIVRPASSSAPRTLSAMIWNMLFSGAKRVGCSKTPPNAVWWLRSKLILRSLSLQFGEEFFDCGVDLAGLLGSHIVRRIGNHLETCASDAFLEKLGVGRRSNYIVGAGQDQRGLVDPGNLLTQINLRAANHVGPAHARIGPNLFAPPFPNYFGMLGNGFG